MATKLESYDAMQAKGFRSGKTACPACKQNTFVPYTDTYTGEFIDVNLYGMCDRKNNCEYHEYPKDYFVNNGNGAFYAPQTVTNIIPFTRPPSYVNRLPYSYVTKSLANINSDCNFIKYLIKIFDKEVTQFLIDKYLLGVDSYDDVIFWQIDAQNEVRAGKTIPYRPEGKRKRKPETEYELGWIHKKAKDKSGALLYPNYKSEQCLFGEHLLRENLDAPVIIFESEKTAVVASIYAPFYFDGAICLATGGVELLSAEKLEVLAGREICLAPDAGVTSWAEKFPDIPVWDLLDGEKEGSDFVDYIPKDANDKALTLDDNLYYWPDGEVLDDFARNAIYLNFKYFNHHKNNEAPNVSRRTGLQIS